jgi:hypothetical protein
VLGGWLQTHYYQEYEHGVVGHLVLTAFSALRLCSRYTMAVGCPVRHMCLEGVAISGPSTACCASLHALECMPAIDACLQGNSALAHASDTGNVVWFWRAAVSRCAPQLPTLYLFLLPPPVCRFAGTQLNPTAHRFARLCLKDCYSVCVVTAT